MLIYLCVFHYHNPAAIDFEFEQLTYNVNEGDGFVEVCVNLVSGTLPAITPISLDTAPVTATGIVKVIVHV